MHAEVVTLSGHLGRNVRALSTRDKTIATGGEDGAVKLWKLTEITAKNDVDEHDEI